MSHTSGPWKYEHGREEKLRDRDEIIGPEGEGIALVLIPVSIPNERYPREMYANGRLIAAAPEMLEFITDISKWACDCEPPGVDELGTAPCRGCEAREIIRKLTDPKP